mmetsp:Transcript_44740/g.138058  ORF Transcript_44740/g.138058 Transcript_44740/m.138058 type:complete len:255 (+) Transcript_44740:457-1221(+)
MAGCCGSPLPKAVLSSSNVTTPEPSWSMSAKASLTSFKRRGFIGPRRVRRNSVIVIEPPPLRSNCENTWSTSAVLSATPYVAMPSLNSARDSDRDPSSSIRRRLRTTARKPLPPARSMMRRRTLSRACSGVGSAAGGRNAGPPTGPISTLQKLGGVCGVVTLVAWSFAMCAHSSISAPPTVVMRDAASASSGVRVMAWRMITLAPTGTGCPSAPEPSAASKTNTMSLIAPSPAHTSCFPPRDCVVAVAFSDVSA